MTPTLQAQVICPEPEPLIAAPDDGGDAQYFALAKKLGVRNAFMVRRELQNALREENIRVYDRKAVYAWMNGLVGKENDRLRTEWEKGKSPEEISKVGRIETANGTVITITADSWFGGVRGPQTTTWGWSALRKEDRRKMLGVLGGLYPHAVPFAALTTMERISERVPDARFLISDYAVEEPDPFMMVTHKLLGTDGFVIERWDEPGFRG